jgi:XTP/dITP diphosphohydrolase
VKRIVLATGNPGKVAELSSLVAGLDLEVVPLSSLQADQAEETGLTFVENAILKARTAAAAAGAPALADDSGLEVDALSGAPGIHSARYAGPGASDADNVRLLLERLEGVPESRRRARFRCVLVALRHARDPAPLICQGTWEGRILPQPLGRSGFGYDPVFFALDAGCSAAELSSERKNQLSHRGKAMAQLKVALGRWL